MGYTHVDNKNHCGTKRRRKSAQKKIEKQIKVTEFHICTHISIGCFYWYQSAQFKWIHNTNNLHVFFSVTSFFAHFKCLFILTVLAERNIFWTFSPSQNSVKSSHNSLFHSQHFPFFSPTMGLLSRSKCIRTENTLTRITFRRNNYRNHMIVAWNISLGCDWKLNWKSIDTRKCHLHRQD